MRSLSMLVATVAVVGATAAGAATISSASLFGILPSGNMGCSVTNVGTKPVMIGSAKMLSGNGSVITLADTCSDTLLQPGADCAFNCALGCTNVSPHGIVVVGGSARNVRGQCALFNGTTDIATTPMN